jgi:hypothetical protein
MIIFVDLESQENLSIRIHLVTTMLSWRIRILGTFNPFETKGRLLEGCGPLTP